MLSKLHKGNAKLFMSLMPKETTKLKRNLRITKIVNPKLSSPQSYLSSGHFQKVNNVSKGREKAHHKESKKKTA
jgi:hypothetical protein